MRQADKTLDRTISSALTDAHDMGKNGGRGGRPGFRFNAESATQALLSDLCRAGFDIVRKPLTIAEADAIIEEGYTRHPRGEEAMTLLVDQMTGKLMEPKATITVEPGCVYGDVDALGNLNSILRTTELGLKLEREKVKLARTTASVDTTSGAIDLPRPVAKVTVCTDTTPDGTNVCVFGWSEDCRACWLLNHSFVPAMEAARG
ncbi:hypothetical protein ACLBXJ_15650 [Methylobacterium mesophilicum]